MSIRSNLAKQSVKAIKWGTFGNIARYGVQLGAQIILARLLGPDNYGLFALGMIVLNLSNILADFGFAWGLVQTQDLSKKDIRFVFTWQLISGAVAAVALYTLAPIFASFFNEPRTIPIIQWLSLVCLIDAVSAPARNLLRRNLDFKWLSIIEITSYVIGYIGIGIPLAFYGAGVWSLVAAWITQALLTLLIAFIRSPHSIKLLFWYEGASSMTGIGSTVFGTNVCNWLLSNFDRILLGRLLNVHSVGLYSVGYNLANTPNSLFIGALQPAFLAAGARVQSEPGRLRSAYLSVLASVWILILPMFVLLAVIAQDLVGVLYGPDWAQTGIVLAILAISMPAYVTWGMSTPILWNTGRKHWEMIMQLPLLFVAAFVFFKLASQGVVIAAIVMACTILLRAIVITTAACRRLKVLPRDLFGFVIRGIFMAFLAMTGTIAGVELGRLIEGSAHLNALLGGILLGGSVLIVIPFMFPRILGTATIEMLGRFSPALFASFDRRLHSNSKSYTLFGLALLVSGVLIGALLLYTSIWIWGLSIFK